LLFCRGTAPYASYLSKRALVQDAAYSTLLRGRRQELHARVAAALEEHSDDLVERQPELLAHHLAAAGDTGRAVEQWLKAGRHAAGQLAYLEAIAHFGRGLSPLHSLPESKIRNSREIELQLALGLCQFPTKGADEARSPYMRALELAETSGEPHQRFEALYGLWQSNAVSGRIAAASPLSERLLRLTEGEGDDGSRLQAHHSGWATRYWAGNQAKAREHAPTPGAGSTIRRSMRLTVLPMADMIPVSAPDIVALSPNGCSDIPRRLLQALLGPWHRPRGSPTLSRCVWRLLSPRCFTSIAASPNEPCANLRALRRWLQSSGSR
jgi:tetratricopeptide (TPR) repeat protein